MEELQLQHAPEQWRLFVDLSEVSLRTVLLHNGNKHPSIPLAYAVHTKETYASFQGLLTKIRYKDNQWNKYVDLQVVAMLTGLQGG